MDLGCIKDEWIRCGVSACFLSPELKTQRLFQRHILKKKEFQRRCAKLCLILSRSHLWCAIPKCSNTIKVYKPTQFFFYFIAILWKWWSIVYLQATCLLTLILISLLRWKLFWHSIFFPRLVWSKEVWKLLLQHAVLSFKWKIKNNKNGSVTQP